LNTVQYQFGRRLRDQRERRGLTLEAIADSTKIKASCLAALERGDIDPWPSGLFRRAYFRAYAAEVGVAPEPLMAEFLRLFGDEAASAQSFPSPTRDGSLRLTLAADRRWSIKAVGRRALASAVDLCGVFAISTALAWLLHADFSVVCGLVALTYYVLATTALGQSVTLWWLTRRVLHRSHTRTASARGPQVLVLRPHDTQRNQSPPDVRETASAPSAQAAAR
jgi:transcriptional regulator with XRE-family HTH domain